VKATDAGTRPDGARAAPRVRFEVALALVIAALGLAVWGPTWRHGFVWDDEFFIQNNESLRSVRFIPAHFAGASTAAAADMADLFPLFRPLRNLSWQFDFAVAGLRPGWWHLHNVLLHLLNAWLAGLLGRRLTGRRDAGLVAALVLLLHPIVSETVCWVKCRDDLLSASLVLAAAVLWVRWRGGPFSPARGAALGAMVFLACLAKESAVVAPALLVALDLGAGRLSRAGLRDAVRRAALPLAAAAAFLVWRHAVLGGTAQCGWIAGSAGRTRLTMIPAFAEYARLVVVPYPLLADYDGFAPVSGWTDPALRRGGVVLLLAAALGGWLARRVPCARPGLAWALLALLPVSNLVPMMQYLAERFFYLPLAGLALAAGAAAARARDRAGPAVPALLACVLAVWTGLDIARRSVWRDNVSLFSVTVEDAPGVLRPRRNLAAALMRAGRPADALPVARETWRLSRGRPDVPREKRAEDGANSASVLLATGRDEEARAVIEELVRDYGDTGWPHMLLGIYFGRRGDTAQALVHLQRAREARPDDPKVLNNLGVALREAGRTAEAEEAFRRAQAHPAAERDPGLNLAALLWSRGDRAGAAEVYRRLLVRWPGDPEATRWLRRAGDAAP
jgi:tetratricopeptide (TPR) repeat protein